MEPLWGWGQIEFMAMGRSTKSRISVCGKRSPGYNFDDGRLEAEEVVMMGKPLQYVLGWLR